MLHTNEVLKDRFGLIGYLMDFVSAEMYEATSIKNFIDNEDKIKGTPMWKIFKHSKYNGEAIITFSNINLELDEDDQYGNQSCYLIDINEKLGIGIEIPFFTHSSAQKKYLTNGKYYEVGIRFQPKNGYRILEYTKKDEPAISDKTFSLDLLIKNPELINANR